MKKAPQARCFFALYDRIFKQFVMKACADVHTLGEQSHGDKKLLAALGVGERGVFALDLLYGIINSESIYVKLTS